MAEGDTIVRAARRLERALAGSRVTATAPNPRGRGARIERLDGETFEAAEARGKHLLLHFGELTLHSHLGMNGSWHTYRPGERWRKPRGAAWCVLDGDRAAAAQFGGPTLRLLPRRGVERDPQLVRLGPDVLASDVVIDDLVASLRRAPEMELGEALLDQRLVAGIGNIFKSEACFAAAADPWSRVGELDSEVLAAVLGAARELMSAAVEEGRAAPAVYRRAGAPCRRCGARVASRGQGDANRTTYWCPRCQGGGPRSLRTSVTSI